MKNNNNNNNNNDNKRKVFDNLIEENGDENRTCC